MYDSPVVTGQERRHCDCGTGVTFRWIVLMGLLSLAGCTPLRLGCPHGTLSSELSPRVGREVTCVAPGEFVLPPDVMLEDGVSEDEAVATALSNNSDFQALLMQLPMSEGDLIQASLLTNPNLTTFIPVGVKQWEWTLFLPIEAFILRPQRMAIAERDYHRVAESLVQNGLTLVRDVRVAHTDLALATERLRLAKEGVKIRKDIADLTQRRLQRGDISELESMTAQIDALNAQANVGVLEQNVVIARAQLALLMGLPPDLEPLDATLDKPPSPTELDSQCLIEEAFATRPDVVAAQWAASAAANRAEAARYAFWRVDAVADANGEGLKGFEIGPGIRLDIPIFNRNQGGRQRANAEFTQALHNLDAAHDRVVQEVRTAVAQWTQASSNLAILEGQITPSLYEARQIAERGFADGGTDYMLVLQTTSQYLDARSRTLDQIAALRRARAELERSVGHSLTVSPETDDFYLETPPSLFEYEGSDDE